MKMHIVQLRFVDRVFIFRTKMTAEKSTERIDVIKGTWVLDSKP